MSNVKKMFLTTLLSISTISLFSKLGTTIDSLPPVSTNTSSASGHDQEIQAIMKTYDSQGKTAEEQHVQDLMNLYEAVGGQTDTEWYNAETPKESSEKFYGVSEEEFQDVLTSLQRPGAVADTKDVAIVKEYLSDILLATLNNLDRALYFTEKLRKFDAAEDTELFKLNMALLTAFNQINDEAIKLEKTL